MKFSEEKFSYITHTDFDLLQLNLAFVQLLFILIKNKNVYKPFDLVFVKARFYK